MSEIRERARVLVVDDDPDMRGLMVAALRAVGCETEEAQDGVEALGWAVATPFHAVVTDVMMPRIDGLTLLARLRDMPMLRGARLVVVSAKEDYAQEAAALDADLFLPKPFAPLELAKAVQDLLDRLPPVEEPSSQQDLTRLEVAFGGIRPHEIVTALHQASRTAVLSLEASPGGRAIVHIEGGQILGTWLWPANGALLEGEMAFRQACGWSEGRLRIQPGDPRTPLPGESNITRLTPQVLADVRPTSTPPQIPGLELRDVLAEGQRYVVHRATPGEGEEPVRVLVGAPHALADTERLTRLSQHPLPGFAQLRRWGDLPDGRRFLETDLPRGSTLETLVLNRGPLGVLYSIQLMSAVLERLERAHPVWGPHGALDARRVVVLPDDTPVLLDHGLLSRTSGPEDALAVQTTAPEAWRGEAPHDASDQYAVGVLLWFALQGAFPFAGQNLLEICRRHLEEPPPSVDPAAEALKPVLDRLLAKLPESRYPSLTIAREALEQTALRIRVQQAENIRAWFPDAPPSGYRFLRILGRGASGAVYEAFHTTLETTHAIKALSDSESRPHGRERFRTEARLSALLSHPGIVRVFDAREEGDRWYLIMEHVVGESLRTRIRREGSLELGEVLSVARQTLEALEAVHARGVVHRDLKPDNLLVDTRGYVKVADFGLAISLTLDSPSQLGRVFGTPNFISPEQAQGLAAEPRSDLYSLGATLFFALTGRPLFMGASSTDTIRCHADDPTPDLQAQLPSIPPEVTRTLQRLLEKSPQDRFPDARAVLDALPNAPSTLRPAQQAPPTMNVTSNPEDPTRVSPLQRTRHYKKPRPPG